MRAAAFGMPASVVPEHLRAKPFAFSSARPKDDSYATQFGVSDLRLHPVTLFHDSSRAAMTLSDDMLNLANDVE